MRKNKLSLNAIWLCTIVRRIEKSHSNHVLGSLVQMSNPENRIQGEGLVVRNKDRDIET